jgi:hypothetical protein
MKKVLLKWFPLAIVITMLCGIAYVIMQQNYRMNANDPQIQIAHDVILNIEAGSDPKSIDDLTKIEMAKSLSPFVIVYDKDKKVIANESTLNGESFLPPANTLDNVGKKYNYFIFTQPINENRFTWQPQKDVRIAAVLVKYDNGYVLAGRNMKEIETRIINLGIMTLIGWVTALVVSFLMVVFTQYIHRRLKHTK